MSFSNFQNWFNKEKIMDIRKILALAVIFSFAGSMAFAAEEAPKKNEKMPQKIEGKMPPAPEHAGKPDGKKMFQAPGMEKGMKGCPMHEKGEKMCQNCKKMDRKEAKKDHGWDKDRKPDFKKNDRKGKKGFFGFKHGWFKGNDEMGKKREANEKEIMSMVKDSDSEFAKHLSSLKKSEPKQYEKAMRTLSARLFFFKNNKKDEKAKAMISEAVASVKAQTEVSELLAKYRKASKDQKEEIRQQLKTGLDKLFDLKLKEQQGRIQNMEEALSEQKKQLEEKKANKSRIVETRLEEITGDGFRW